MSYNPSGKLPPPNIGWRQQKSKPYHTMVGFGFIFINCTKKKEQSTSLLFFFDIVGRARSHRKLHASDPAALFNLRVIDFSVIMWYN